MAAWLRAAAEAIEEGGYEEAPEEGAPEAQHVTTARKTNRQNARHSTGPRSIAGKERSARNARKHGLSVLLARSASATNGRLHCRGGAGEAELVDRFCESTPRPSRTRLPIYGPIKNDD